MIILYLVNFLDVLEKAGFCKNVYNAEKRKNSITLNPVIYGNVAIYGYPGRKSGLEIADLKKLNSMMLLVYTKYLYFTQQ